MKNSKIQWTDHTFNPWIGCTRISPACDHCYAATSTPVRAMGIEWNKDRHRTSPAYWRQPLGWDREAAASGVRRRVFCASLADVFDNQVPQEWRNELFSLIGMTPNLDWLLLTKRIGNAHEMLSHAAASVGLSSWDEDPWRNVSIGITICDQEELDRDVIKLIRLPAWRRFLSIEPLIERVTFAGHWMEYRNPDVHENWLERINWVIVGGESGPGARPMEIEWAEVLRDQVQSVGTAFFMKQLGGVRNKRGELEDLPESLRIREFPRAT